MIEYIKNGAIIGALIVIVNYVINKVTGKNYL